MAWSIALPTLLTLQNQRILSFLFVGEIDLIHTPSMLAALLQENAWQTLVPIFQSVHKSERKHWNFQLRDLHMTRKPLRFSRQMMRVFVAYGLTDSAKMLEIPITTQNLNFLMMMNFLIIALTMQYKPAHLYSLWLDQVDRDQMVEK